MSFSLPGKVLLAPMAGISDAAFREQCKEFGAALTTTELTSVEGLVRKEQLSDILDVRPGEFPSVQLFGNDVNSIVRAARLVEPLASVIDFNLGCPAPHITAQACGAALLMDEDYLHRIFSSLVDAVKLPVTAKIRAGPNEHNLVYKRVGKTLEDAGVQMIAFHPRTVKQGYSGSADWSRIKELKESLSIPVCGNGDVDSPEKAQAMLEQTGCDYVMIGRAARGNPFLFRQCNDFLKKGSYDLPSEEDRIKAWHDYLDKAVGFGVPFARLKIQAQNFSRGLGGARRIRGLISAAKDLASLRDAF